MFMANVFWGEESDGTYTSGTNTSQYWPIWVSQNTPATSNIIWRHWSNQAQTQISNLYHAQRGGYEQVFPTQEPVVRTAAEIAAADARHNRQMEELRAASRRQREAEDRAEQLLLSHLTPKQKEDYRKHKYICFKGRSGVNYRLKYGTVGNV